MSALAMGLLKKGCTVSGSDLIRNNETKKLEQLGAVIFYPMFIFYLNQNTF